MTMTVIITTTKFTLMTTTMMAITMIITVTAITTATMIIMTIMTIMATDTTPMIITTSQRSIMATMTTTETNTTTEMSLMVTSTTLWMTSMSGKRSGAKATTSQDSTPKLSLWLLSRLSEKTLLSLTTTSMISTAAFPLMMMASPITTTASTKTTTRSSTTTMRSLTRRTELRGSRGNAGECKRISTQTETSSSFTASSLPSPKSWSQHALTS